MHINKKNVRLSQINNNAPSKTLGCHEAVVHTLPRVSPEVVEETFFLFSSGEWEAGCDASSPLDTPGVTLNKTKTTMQCQRRLRELSEM